MPTGNDFESQVLTLWRPFIPGADPRASPNSALSPPATDFMSVGEATAMVRILPIAASARARSLLTNSNG